MLGALSSRSALSVLVGALFKKFGLFSNTVYLVNINYSFIICNIPYLFLSSVKIFNYFSVIFGLDLKNVSPPKHY
jgi:hypothetical protein